MNYRLDLPPGKTDYINTPGDFFAVVQSAIDLEIGLVGREKALYSQGDTYTCGPGESFKSIGIRNPTAGTVTVIIFSGFGRYSQARQSVVEPKTRVIGAAGTLAGNTSIDLDPNLFLINGDIRRKAVVISNKETSGRLELRTVAATAATAFLTIEPETSITVPISERFFLVNPDGAAKEYALGQIFWTV